MSSVASSPKSAASMPELIPLEEAFLKEVVAVPLPQKVSLYIPKVPRHFTVEFMAYCFQLVGTIRRIDFVRIKNFDTKEVDANYKKCYIHFDVVYDTAYTQTLFKCLNNGSAAIPIYDSIRGVEPNTGKPASWTFYVYLATNAVENTDMNIHQLAHVYELHDNDILDLKKELKEKEERIARLEEMVFELRAAVSGVERR